MCDEHGRMFHQVDQMEQEIDEAIAQTETRLHLS
jgi:predicted component of type VI protein secretion system